MPSDRSTVPALQQVPPRQASACGAPCYKPRSARCGKRSWSSGASMSGSGSPRPCRAPESGVAARVRVALGHAIATNTVSSARWAFSRREAVVAGVRLRILAVPLVVPAAPRLRNHQAHVVEATRCPRPLPGAPAALADPESARHVVRRGGSRRRRRSGGGRSPRSRSGRPWAGRRSRRSIGRAAARA
jgi:hypothetical protein